MRKSARISVAFAIYLVACSNGEPGQVATVADDAPAPDGSVTLAATPPMGFNTWNRFGCDVSDQLVRGIADAMVESGMRDAGYEYVVIDDCWQVDRGDDGLIVPDPDRFPAGMKALADYVHEKGLKFGLYT
ncbi:MAG: alpha-galactosidase, partial [Gemmatimonadetes bacterium]|nr:alpha-galactosidase [Gemmatimonadota bacterium]